MAGVQNPRDMAVRGWIAALLALTLLRLGVSAVLPLAGDETYYWIWSRALSPGYLDHPPMVALWIRAGTLIAGESPFGIRLMGPLSAATGSLLLADAARCLLPAACADRIAVGLLNATLLFSVGSVIITPDTPLLLFWTASFWAAVHAARSGRTTWWLVTGVFAGLAMASKYTAILLWAGLALWVLATPALRPQLRRLGPWVAALAAVAMFAPVIAWNAAHGWASFLRQGGRAADWRPDRAAEFVGELLGGQIALATPLIFVLCIAGIGMTCRLAWQTRNPGAVLLASLTLPGALVFLQHAIGDRVQGNWPAILYPAACVAAAGLVMPVLQRLERPAIWLGLVCAAAVYAQAITGALPIPPKLDPIALQLSGWDMLARKVEQVRESTDAGYVVADQYAVASELAYLLPSGVPVFGAESRWALTALPHDAPPDGPGLLVSQHGSADIAAALHATNVSPLTELGRGPVQKLHLYRITTAPLRGTWARLPRPEPMVRPRSGS